MTRAVLTVGLVATLFATPLAQLSRPEGAMGRPDLRPNDAGVPRTLLGESGGSIAKTGGMTGGCQCGAVIATGLVGGEQDGWASIGAGVAVAMHPKNPLWPYLQDARASARVHELVLRPQRPPPERDHPR